MWFKRHLPISFILQRATYHYINVEAQFQVFNEKNWFYLEDGLREHVVKNGKDYTVYTGSHGVMELDDINNNKVEIYLNLERADLARLPAPRYDYYHHHHTLQMIAS